MFNNITVAEEQLIWGKAATELLNALDQAVTNDERQAILIEALEVVAETVYKATLDYIR
jgi:hypothetical protein